MNGTGMVANEIVDFLGIVCLSLDAVLDSYQDLGETREAITMPAGRIRRTLSTLRQLG
ncbi:MAG: hypothetical protein RLZZ117_65 [Cyanobacteriota bacterium]|jgi:hypothetical protein